MSIVNRNYFSALFLRFKDLIRIFLHPKISKDNKQKNKERSLFYYQFVSSGSLVFDVGANFGNRIDPLLKIRAKIIAVEPQTLCYEYLKLKYRRSVILEKKAMGEREGELPLFINDNASTISSLSEEWISKVKIGRFSNSTWSKFEVVKVETLDRLINKYGLPEFIKIDVEGFELEVLKGLNHSPKYISIEYTIPECLENTLSCLIRLNQINPNYIFNFSIAENNRLEFSEWKSFIEFYEIVKNNSNLLLGFGDIYAKCEKFV